MRSAIQSERLKEKHSGMASLMVLVPLTTFLVSVLISGASNASRAMVYWWELLFMSVLMSAFQWIRWDYERSAAHGQNRAFSGMPEELLVAADLLLVTIRTVLSSAICCLFVAGIARLTAGAMETHPIPFGRYCLAFLAILLAEAWMIPVTQLASVRPGGVILVVLCCINMALGPLAAQTTFWYLAPASYPFVATGRLLSIHPSGALEDYSGGTVAQAMRGKPYAAVLLGILLAAVLAALVLWKSRRTRAVNR
jgi:hypothetical protein